MHTKHTFVLTFIDQVQVKLMLKSIPIYLSRSRKVVGEAEMEDSTAGLKDEGKVEESPPSQCTPAPSQDWH